ncbi:MAG: response regulator [Acidobacteriota bacterium]
MIVQCPKCLRRYRLQDTKAKLLRVKCRSCGNQFLVSPSDKSSHEIIQEKNGKTAVVADIQRDFRSFIVGLLASKKFNLFIADEGETAWHLVKEKKPNLLFVSPYLPKLMGIDLIQRIRETLNDPPKIFLLGAIHNSKRYRRRPETLYGADDYIDEGFSEKKIIHKVSYHLGIKNDIDQESVDNDAIRLARSIFADLLVYEMEKMEKVKKVEDFFSLFSQEAAEGQRYLEENFPGSKNLLNFVVAEYLKRKAHK